SPPRTCASFPGPLLPGGPRAPPPRSPPTHSRHRCGRAVASCPQFPTADPGGDEGTAIGNINQAQIRTIYIRDFVHYHPPQNFTTLHRQGRRERSEGRAMNKSDFSRARTYCLSATAVAVLVASPLLSAQSDRGGKGAERGGDTIETIYVYGEQARS